MKNAVLLSLVILLTVVTLGCSESTITVTPAQNLEYKTIGERVNDFLREVELDFGDENIPDYGMKLEVNFTENPQNDSARITIIFESGVKISGVIGTDYSITLFEEYPDHYYYSP